MNHHHHHYPPDKTVTRLDILLLEVLHGIIVVVEGSAARVGKTAYDTVVPY